MSYNKEELTGPFWAEFPLAASGRDPLAIQNSSVVIYTKMMVGITNVTNRVRYNGFYCWLLELILRNSEIKGSVNEQIRYLRRAELLIAYMMVSEFPDVTGVSGSAFASRRLQENIDLAAGADIEPKKGGNLYWAFRGGVFGQYYSGVVNELGLIHQPSPLLNIYSLTPKGKQLSRHFQANLPSGLADKFWSYLEKGNLGVSDLAELTPFALHDIPDSQELYFYRSMLLDKDDQGFIPSFYRKETIHLLLETLSKSQDGKLNLVYRFLGENYRQHISKIPLLKKASTFWYIYELNEILHVTLEHFHASLLWSIDSQPTSLNTHLEKLSDLSAQAFKDFGFESKETLLTELMGHCNEIMLDTYHAYNQMQTAMNDYDFGRCLMEALFCMTCVYRDCHLQLDGIENLASLPEYNFNRTGYVVLLLRELFTDQMNQSLDHVIKKLLHTVINLHVFTSYRKSKVGQALVHNYIIEEGMIWRARETAPRRTTPRLQNTLQYMGDVGWISRANDSYLITASGKEVLLHGN